MLSVRLICVGKLKEKYYIDAVKEYETRLLSYCRLDVAELPEERLGQKPVDSEIQAAQRKESEAIKSNIPAGLL
jgi:23S rRNA (pseudouridine1915-N3)-methyltransferase